VVGERTNKNLVLAATVFIDQTLSESPQPSGPDVLQPPPTEMEA
jgi:hypothetical protein